MQTNWERLGHIFLGHHSQLPVSDVLEDRISVYYSTRDLDGKSVPMKVDLDINDPTVIITRPLPVELKLGKPGFFDWSGIMPTKLLSLNGVKMLYYIGWSRRIDVPYHNNLGLAISEDGGNTWNKFSDGPIFSTSSKEPGYIGTAEILIENGKCRMWYLSCREWFKHKDIMEPVYDIKYAESLDGINWSPSGETHIHLLGDEGGISASSVLKTRDGYEMLFSVRNKTGYREERKDSYRIKKAFSEDGFSWKREERTEIDPGIDEWENFMVCYPCVTPTSKNVFLFYNGNGFGKTGIGIAKKITT
jgi:hypothetical protein